MATKPAPHEIMNRLDPTKQQQQRWWILNHISVMLENRKWTSCSVKTTGSRNRLLGDNYRWKGIAVNITKTHLFKYIENFTTKNENFQMKNSGVFHISNQKIDCGYVLEPRTHNLCLLSRNKKFNVYPCKPKFYCIKVGFKGVKSIQDVFAISLLPLVSSCVNTCINSLL